MKRINWHYLMTMKKATEGGTPQWMVRSFCESIDVRVKFERSGYVAHYDVLIDTRNKRTMARIDRQFHPTLARG